jgi:hypothetical protein
MNGEPRRLIEDPEAPGEVAQDIQEAIDLGISGPGVGAESVMDQLDTSIAILEEDLEEEEEGALPPATSSRHSQAALLVGLLAFAVFAALVAWVLLSSGSQ